MSTPAPDTALDRMQKVLYVACGIGAIVFGALLLPGDSGWVAQRDSLAGWFWWVSVLGVIVLPASLLVIAPLAAPRTRRAVARTAVGTFVMVQLLWVPAMTVPVLPHGTTPWLQGITALPSTLVGVTWRSRWVWLFPLVEAGLVTAVQLAASDRPAVDAVLDGLGALIFCSVLTGIAQAVLKAGEAQDRAGDRAREEARLTASASAHEREQGRINAIVHDDIMSVLLAASRDDPDPRIGSRAHEAIATVRSLVDPRPSLSGARTADDAAATLRAAAVAEAPHAVVDLEAAPDGEIPGDAVAACAEAMTEALRNARLHAGTKATVTVQARVSGEAITIRVRDSGSGFDPESVPPTRLGVRASIVERMALLPGGSSRITSRPGTGTTITIAWRRP